jgi:hypothetical protein
LDGCTGGRVDLLTVDFEAAGLGGQVDAVVVLEVLSGRAPIDIVLHPGVHFPYHAVAQG